MEHSIKEISESKREIVITITEEEFKPHMDKKFKEIQPEVNLKGFRKGRVPMSMVKKLYGPQVKVEVYQETSSELFTKIVQEKELKIIGDPGLKDIDEKDGNISFTIDFEILPNFELAEYKGLTIDEPVHNVEDEEVDTEIEEICRNNGELIVEEEIVDQFFMVGLKFVELDQETGVPIIGTEEDKTQVYLAHKTVLPELREKLINKKVGDNVKFNPFEFDPRSPNKEFQITVTSIERIIPKEFTNEFVSNYTKGKFLTTEELRDEIGYKIQDKWDEKSKELIESQIVDSLVKLHDFDPPEIVIQNVAKEIFESVKKQYKDIPGAANLQFEQMENDLRPSAIHKVKWTMIRTAIIEKEGIEVEEYDIEPIAQAQAESTDSDAATIKNILMKNDNFKENILSKKLLEFILDFAITEELTFDEYHEKYYPENQNVDNVEDVDKENNEEPKSNIIVPGSDDNKGGEIITP